MPSPEQRCILLETLQALDEVLDGLPGTPARLDPKVYTDNRFSGVALSDTLGFFDDRLLLTLGARWQRVKVDDWTDAPSTSINEDEIFPPFISRQVEVGAKYEAGPFAVTAAVFRIKQPVYETNATTRVFGPNGKRQNDGVELSMFGEPLKGLRLPGGAFLRRKAATL